MCERQRYYHLLVAMHGDRLAFPHLVRMRGVVCALNLFVVQVSLLDDRY